ncbi:NrfD/PsrC family molybdoenzyme membrane anchor subunit [Kineococcus terrestris]|uniref:NrfD/PsrC family molybdoenzyme membrane anchor subunit n=1 Tax=Kineococcus terrestris TaxID=2044856 RepID=UPI0034DACE2F
MSAQQRSATATEPTGGYAARMWEAGIGHRGGGRKGKRGDVNAVVPEAEFGSYYGRAVLKPPTWTHEIAYYLFTGGLASGCSMLAAVADARGHTAARRGLRITSLGAVGASAYFLIVDLGRPDRFYNMLRMAKITSPMSVGTWILSAFGPLCGVAAVSEAADLLPREGAAGALRRLVRAGGSAAGAGAALTAPLLATYTAVLFADTAVPSWHEPYRELPFVFGGSALAAGSGAALVLAPPAQTATAARLAALGATAELVAAHRMESAHGIVSEPFHTGRPARFLRAARALTVAGAAGAVLGRRSRVVAALSGVSLMAGSLLTRVAVFEAGVASTLDPKYVVVPQRERLAARAG